MKIRKATNKDIGKVAEIYKIESKKEPYNENWSKKDAVKKIKEHFKNNFVFILDIDREIAGFIMGRTYLWDDGLKGFVELLVVQSKFQKKGFGKKLVEHAKNYFKKKKVKEISLMCEKGSKAFKFYKKFGFKEEQFVSMSKKF